MDMLEPESAADQDEISLGALRDLAGYHLRRASAAVAADFARTLEGTGMRQVLLAILLVVEANPGIGQGLAGKALGIQRANMVSLINDLIDRKLLARRVSDSDRRAFELSVTAKGKELLAACLERIAEHEARMLSELTSQERTTLLELLSRIESRGA